MDSESLCITALGSFAVLLIIARFIGHKQIVQLDFFGYVTGIAIGAIAAEMATEPEEPWKPLAACPKNQNFFLKRWEKGLLQTYILQQAHF